jgi:hypothetical protein
MDDPKNTKQPNLAKSDAVVGWITFILFIVAIAGFAVWSVVYAVCGGEPAPLGSPMVVWFGIISWYAAFFSSVLGIFARRHRFGAIGAIGSILILVLYLFMLFMLPGVQ